MRNLFLTVLLCWMAAVYGSAQESAFKQNDNVVSLGVGFGGTLYTNHILMGNDYTRLPVFTLSYERCIIGNLFNEQSALGIGGLVGYTSAKYWGWKTTDFIIGARGALHYAFVDKLDTYVGAMIGYNVHTWKWRSSIDNDTRISDNSGLTASLFVGARYYFTDSFAAFAEVGYGYSFFNAGLSIRF